MEQDQVKKQDQDNAGNLKNEETNQDRGESKDQETISDSTEKVRKELEEKFKSEIAGLNRKTAELEKQLKDKEREKLTETEKAKAELEDIKAEREQAERERNELRKKRIIDNALYEIGLPADLFEDRISGESEAEIKEDVKRINDYVKEHIEKEVERRTKELLKGKDPGRQDSSTAKLTLDEISKIPDRETRVKAMKENGFYQ